ncbi:response regulator transcription factor [Cohnella hashimotonis]|uniref:Response regulator n=1 Tax=Cohnella hashimotonis TaxID=2826895 RepID=A0ABT6TJ88_9BACL|nr:response regulator [Cohnella hashimotonis]MDI4646890.1 response regulator [Cohnella hashimotonis]
MTQVLIVDDEPIIVNSIHQLLSETERMDLTLHCAYNVYEALDCLQRVRIDIVISDIRMPGMTGIELQDRIVRSWPRCKIIFLTGYNDFDYARQAIRSGGIVDYVLKNEDDQVLIDAVRKALEQLEQVESREKYMAELKSKLYVQQSSLRSAVLLSQMLDPLVAGGDRSDLFAGAGIALTADKPALLVVGRIDDWKEGTDEADHPLLLYACQNIAEEYLRPSAVFVSLVFDSNRLLWFIQPGGEGGETPWSMADRPAEEVWDNLKSRLYGVMEVVQDTCRRMLRLSVSFAIGRAPVPWNGMSASFRHLNGLLGEDRKDARSLLIQDGEHIPGNGQGAGTACQDQSEEAQQHRLVVRLNGYIQDHLHGDLSLTRLSEVVHHSPTYLSRLYKRMTGRMLSDYITDERMERARTLLAEPALRIQDVASRIGYEAAPQFNRSFKKRYKMTPQEYRDRLLYGE